MDDHLPQFQFSVLPTICNSTPGNTKYCLTGRLCRTRLGPGGPDSSKSSSQAKKPI